MVAQPRLIALLHVVTYAAACPFGGTGSEPLPPGHPNIERRLMHGPQSLSETAYPGYIIDDKAEVGSLSCQWQGGGECWTPQIDALAAKSTEMGDAELCYWSFQTLPGPDQRQADPFVTPEDVDLWFENTDGEAHSFLEMAVKRMQGRVQQDGIVVWTGCSPGKTLRRAMCEKGRSPSLSVGGRLEDCSLDAVWNQTLMTPTAIVMFKIQGSRIDELKAMLSSWRADPNGLSHVPQMTSTLVHQRGWGPGGQIISKVVPCSQIPEKFMYQNLADCDELGDSRTLADEAFEVWSGLCSVTADGCQDDHGFRGMAPSLAMAAAVLAAAAFWLD